MFGRRRMFVGTGHLDGLSKGRSVRLSRAKLTNALVAAMLAIAAQLAVVGLPGRPALAASAPRGCGYGTGGPEARALCWLDMSGYNQTLADRRGRPEDDRVGARRLYR